MQKHSRLTNRGRAYWYTERLWRLAAQLPVQRVMIQDIAEFDQNCWFTRLPTCREVAVHARRIMNADLSLPIILSADGRLMDGGHRVASAWLRGQSEVLARRFENDPEPDYIEAPDPMQADGPDIVVSLAG